MDRHVPLEQAEGLDLDHVCDLLVLAVDGVPFGLERVDELVTLLWGTQNGGPHTASTQTQTQSRSDLLEYASVRMFEYSCHESNILYFILKVPGPRSRPSSPWAR